MNRVYEYRLYPSVAQASALDETCRLLRALYNACLEERRGAWEKQRVLVSRQSQARQLKDIRAEHWEYSAIHSQILHDVVRRIDLSFQSFFRRRKLGETPGYPRFKSRGRYESFTCTQAASRRGARLHAAAKRLYVHGIGKIKIRLHREHQGRVKQIRILRRADGWHAQFVCVEVPAKPLAKTGREIGVDVGISTFAATSDGALYANARHYETAQAALAAAQRKLSCRKRRSNRRRKQQKLVAKIHLKIARQRRDYHHKLALKLVKENDLIAVEDLNIKGLARGNLSKQVHDAGWGQFISILAYKAESAGREFVKVNPNGTSQTCSSCGERVPKDLSVRVHSCPACGYTADRDVNAAKNVLRLGRSLREARGRSV